MGSNRMIDEYLRGALLLGTPEIRQKHDELKEKILKHPRIIFIGNGGSFQGHMAHDFLKVGKIPTLTPDSPSLLTCLANDYPKEQLFSSWLDVVWTFQDLLIAVSSSGESQNIINAIDLVQQKYNGDVVTITGFDKNNTVNKMGNINIHFETRSYGVHELMTNCFLHSILDDLVKNNE